ncbi:MAG: hypothetical protein WB507_07865 [Solirubrobacterales bacterium]
MGPGKEQVLEWERRWSVPAALAAFAAVLLVIGAIVIVTQGVGTGSGDATLLQDVNNHRAAQMISSILQAIGVALLALPLYYLFRAARVRSEKMRAQLVGVVVAAPLFLAGLAILSGVSTLHAASTFVANELPRLTAHRISLSSEHANKLASEAIDHAPLRPLAAGFGIAGQLGFVVGMFYTALYAMRTGLLSRFWGSLGMALGAVSFLFFQFALLWFVYLGLLLLGRVPGGRPPAWNTGEAVPWPTPGEKAAASLNPPSDAEEPEPSAAGNGAAPESPSSRERRKRKQRD